MGEDATPHTFLFEAGRLVAHSVIQGVPHLLTLLTAMPRDSEAEIHMNVE